MAIGTLDPRKGLIWQSQPKTPETIERERRLAEALMMNGEPAFGGQAGPLGVIGRALEGAYAGYTRSQANKAENDGISNAAKKFAGLDLGSLLSGGTAYPSSVAAGGSPTGAVATGTVPQGKFNFGENADALRNGIVETAQAIGADPVDLATAISYETAGTFDPTKAGPRTQYGQHRGLIQFGEPQAEKYGVDWNNPLASQLGPNGAVANYFRSSGFKPGMSGLDLYSTINAGSPGRYTASDANNGGAPGDVRDKWENQMAGHRQKALALLGGGASAAPVQVASLDPSIGIPQAGGATIRAGDYDPALHRGNAPAGGARATFGGPELVYDDKGMRFVDEGAERVAAQDAPQVAPYDFTGNPQLSAGAGMPFQGTQPQQMAALPSQPLPQSSAGPSEELLRQNDMALGGALAPQGSAPVQVADASGYFPAVPSADRAPIMGSYAAPVAPRQGGGNITQLLEAASDPWMNDSQRSMIGMALEQQIRQNDPMRALQAQKLQLEMDALRAKPQTEYGFTTLPDGTVLRTDKRSGNAEPIYSAGQKPTSDMQEYNFAVSQGFKGSFADYQQAMKKAGASSTNVSVGEGDKFYEALDKKNADTFAALSDTGMQARSKLAQVERLGGLMQASPTGAAAALKLAAGEYGIKTDGLDDLQAAQALINELVPQQRQPGSGPMSDADLALFKQSLPRIINTPDGNSLILDTMRGITQYQIQMGDIADRVANREISAAEGRNEIKNLKNPLDGFRASTKDRGTQAAPSGIDKSLWDVMTPEERALWQN